MKKGSLFSCTVLALLLFISHPVWGTASTSDYYEIFGNQPKLKLEDTTTDEADWAVVLDAASNESFGIYSYEAGAYPFIIENLAPIYSIIVKPDGKVGLGTSAPSGAIEVARTGQNVLFVVNRTDGARCGFLAKANQSFIGTSTAHPVLIAAGVSAVAQGGPTIYGDLLTPEEREDIEYMTMDNPPTLPLGSRISALDYIAQSAVLLGQVPTSTWTFGCSAASAGMIFGYCDRTGYSNMYSGCTNGGVAPLTNLGRGVGVTPIPGSCSIIATENGFDCRITDGHVDDYWEDYDEPGPDPWEGSWTEHTWGDCTADYLAPTSGNGILI